LRATIRVSPVDVAPLDKAVLDELDELLPQAASVAVETAADTTRP
jgi:hypothetical protein